MRQPHIPSAALRGVLVASAVGAIAACHPARPAADSGAAASRSTTPAEASADSILQRSRRAAQGTSTEPVRTRVMEGTYEYSGANGQHAVAPLRMHWRLPGILYQEMRAPFGQMRRWSDGSRGWASRPEFPNRPLPDAEISEARRDAALYQPAELGADYTGYASEGRKTVDGRELDVVAATSRFGKTERFYFDPSTGLPVYLDVWEEGPEGLRSVGGGEFYQTRYTLSDYRVVSGRMVPFSIVRKRPNSTAHYRFERVQINVPVDTTLEAPPSVAPGTVVPQP